MQSQTAPMRIAYGNTDTFFRVFGVFRGSRPSSSRRSMRGRSDNHEIDETHEKVQRDIPSNLAGDDARGRLSLPPIDVGHLIDNSRTDEPKDAPRAAVARYNQMVDPLPPPGDPGRSANHPVAHRTFKIATAFSTLMLALSVLLILVGYIVKPSEYHFSFRDDSHFGVSSRGLDSRLVFFNDAEYGPYRGSTIGLIGADGDIYPPLEHEESFGDSWGIYYRHFQRSDSTLWTLMVTLWYPIAFFAIMPFVSLVCSAVRRRASNVAEP